MATLEYPNFTPVTMEIPRDWKLVNWSITLPTKKKKKRKKKERYSNRMSLICKAAQQ